MKQTQEFDGKNLEQAIEKACAALNVTRKKLSYDVISSGSSGIFGIVGVKKAKIRATLPDRKISTNNVGRDAIEEDELDGVMSIVDEAFAEPSVKEKERPKKKPKKSQPKKAAPQKKNDKKAVSKWEQDIETPDFKEPEATEPEVKAPEAKAPEAEAPEAEAPEAKAPVAEAPEAEAPDAEKDLGFEEDVEIDERDEGYPPKYKDEIPVDVTEESVALGVETLQKMVDLITTDSTVVSETDQDRLLLRVDGGNSGVLIGRRGQTLEAMQFLTDKIINRKSESRVRLKVDIEGYMETRKANLQSLAHKMAEKAKKTGKPATINQMTAQDRRIVHLALKDDTRVRTQSMGDGYYRRLVIFPKKGAFKKRRNSRK
ncbi:MAG: Jag N-terminal domain-containing protein [Desulfobacterales bacterium]|nr:Jag N-terminal domain-containing protein [Desulfobacterales bacterium]